MESTTLLVKKFCADGFRIRVSAWPLLFLLKAFKSEFCIALLKHELKNRRASYII